MFAHAFASLIGIWMMTAPSVLGYGGRAAAHDRIVGPIVAALACIAIWEVTRPLRWVYLLAGLWLVAATWVSGFGPRPGINSAVCGASIAALALIRGRRTHQFGGGWRTLLPRRPVSA